MAFVTQFAADQIVQGTTATLTATFVDQDGEPRTPNAVTVGIVASDGTEIIADGTDAGIDGQTAKIVVDPAQTSQLDFWTCTWLDGGSTITTVVEIIGGRYFTIGEARSADKALQDIAKFPDEDIKRVRNEVEVEADRITGRSWRPKFRIDITDTSSVKSAYSASADAPLRLSQIDVRTIRYVKVNGLVYAQQYWELTEAGQIFFGRGIGLLPEQIANGPWRGNLPIMVEVGYEYGWPSPPEDLKRAMITRLRSRLLKDNNTGIAEQATTANDSGTSYAFNTQGPTPLPEVNAVYEAYTRPDWKESFVGSLHIA